jgi:hypothetical protein
MAVTVVITMILPENLVVRLYSVMNDEPCRPFQVTDLYVFL